jgi:hypothetical protein
LALRVLIADLTIEPGEVLPEFWRRHSGNIHLDILDIDFDDDGDSILI